MSPGLAGLYGKSDLLLLMLVVEMRELKDYQRDGRMVNDCSGGHDLVGPDELCLDILFHSLPSTRKDKKHLLYKPPPIPFEPGRLKLQTNLLSHSMKVALSWSN